MSLLSLTYTPYIVLMGDIIHSKSLETYQRYQVQENFSSILKEINQKYANSISSRLQITMGDSFQGLLYAGGDVMHILWEIEQRLYPIRLRFGIGIGNISTQINPLHSEDIDGTAYHNARAAVDYLKKSERKKQSPSADIHICIDNEDQSLERLLNTIFLLSFSLKERWTARQRQIINDILLHQDKQSAVAERLKISQPTVQKILLAGKYYIFKDSFDTITHTLKTLTFSSHV